MDIEKLMMAKAIMDRTKQMDSGEVAKPQQRMQLENFDAPQAKYNLPSDLMEGIGQPQMNIPTKQNNGMGFSKPSVDAIKKSKLPDEIKRLMIEHPIDNPNTMSGPTLSDDLIEKASRLMGTKPQVNEHSQPQAVSSNSDIKKMVKEAVREILSESGLITESTEKSNDVFTFRVGKHLFEGKLTKIKKMR